MTSDRFFLCRWFVSIWNFDALPTIFGTAKEREGKITFLCYQQECINVGLPHK